MLTEREIVQKIREHPKEPGMLKYKLSDLAAAVLIQEHTLAKMESRKGINEETQT